MKSKVQKIFIAFLSSVFAFVLVLSSFVVFNTTSTAYASVEEDGLVVSELDAGSMLHVEICRTIR